MFTFNVGENMGDYMHDECAIDIKLIVVLIIAPFVEFHRIHSIHSKAIGIKQIFVKKYKMKIIHRVITFQLITFYTDLLNIWAIDLVSSDRIHKMY